MKTLQFLVFMATFWSISKADFESDTLMIITGNSDNNAQRGAVQMIKMDTKYNCYRRQQHPLSGFFIMGTYLSNKNTVLTCGDIGDSRSQFCHEYNPMQDTWTESVQMVTRRSQSATVWLDSGTKWWVTGGMGTRLSNSSGTEVYDTNDQLFRVGVSLPEPVQDHCLVKINTTHFFLAGGEMRPNQRTSTSLLCGHAWIYSDEDGFVSMPSMDLKRSAPSCGLVQDPLGSKFIVVAGGNTGGQDQRYTKTVEIFNLQTQTWQGGPELPLALAAAPAVQAGNSFYIMGGYKEKKHNRDSFYSKKIFQFEFYQSWWSGIWWPNTYYQRWRERSEKLKYGTARFPAFWVPSDWC